MSYKITIEKLVKSRNGHKGWVTRVINTLNTLKTENTLSKQILNLKTEQI